MAYNPRTPPGGSVELLTSPSEPCLLSSPTGKPKGVLNEDALVKHNIFVEKNPVTSDGLAALTVENPQAALLTEELLDFDEVLSVENYNRLSTEEQAVVKEHYPSAKIENLEPVHPDDRKAFRSDYQLDYHDLSFDIGKTMYEKAKNIRSKEEERWVDFFRHLIDGVVEDCQNLEGRENLKPGQIIKGLKVEGQQDWKVGAKLIECEKPTGAPVLKCPRVDRFFALPITNLRIPPGSTETSSRTQFRGLSRDFFIQNFDYSTLRDLSSKGLVPNAGYELHQDKKAVEKHLVCFPFAIIELKHHGVKNSEKRYCICQAANGAATCLAMLRKLASHGTDGQRKEVRPVVTFTFIGPEVRAWIAYIDASRQGESLSTPKYNMLCFWEGDIRSQWHSFQLCCILRKVLFWGTKFFRPWVSLCLDQWRHAMDSDHPMIHASLPSIDQLQTEADLTWNDPLGSLRHILQGQFLRKEHTMKEICLLFARARGIQQSESTESSLPDEKHEKPESYLAHALDLIEKAERTFFESVQIRWKNEWPIARNHRLKNLSTRIAAKLNIHRRLSKLNTSGDQSIRIVQELHTKDQDRPPEAGEQEQLAESTEAESTSPKLPITLPTARYKPIVEPKTSERAISVPSFGSLPPRVQGRETVVISSDESDSYQEQPPQDPDRSPSPSPIPAVHDRRMGSFGRKIIPVASSSFLAPREEPIPRSSSAEPVFKGRRRPQLRSDSSRDSSPEAHEQSSPSPPKITFPYKYRSRSHRGRVTRGRDSSSEAQRQSSPSLPKSTIPRKYRTRSHGAQTPPKHYKKDCAASIDRLERDYRRILAYGEDLRELGRNYRVRPSSRS